MAEERKLTVEELDEKIRNAGIEGDTAYCDFIDLGIERTNIKIEMDEAHNKYGRLRDEEHKYRMMREDLLKAKEE